MVNESQWRKIYTKASENESDIVGVYVFILRKRDGNGKGNYTWKPL